MTRVSAPFIAATMMLVAATVGLIGYSVAGLNGSESAIVALAALTCLSLTTAVAMRQRDRTDIGNQIANLSRGSADLARQVAEFGRRLATLEGRIESAESAGAARISAVAGEISDLGAHLAGLSASLAHHDVLLREGARGAAVPLPLPLPDAVRTGAGGASPEPVRHPDIVPGGRAGVVAAGNGTSGRALPPGALRRALDENRLEPYLQPIVTLPQRKVRFYEAVAGLRDDTSGAPPAAGDLIMGTAEAEGLTGRIDHMMLRRAIEVLRRLSASNKDVGVVCNLSAFTLGSAAAFAQCLDFLDANRALAPSFVLELSQSTFRDLRGAAAENENLAALSRRGYRFSMDHVTNLHLEPRELADYGVRYVKVPASLLLDPKQGAVSDTHPSELSDRLGRFGIDLIAEGIEREDAVIDLIDCDVLFGQGSLFAPPRPLRSDSGETSQTEPQLTTTPASRAAFSS